MSDKVVEHWLLDKREEDSDTWYVCRYLGKFPANGWGDVSWKIFNGEHLVYIVHVLCEDYTSYRSDIRGILNEIPGMKKNKWVTFKRVTVDFRE